MSISNSKKLISLHLDSFDFKLPENLIAQKPTLPPSTAKLLFCQKNKSGLQFINETFINMAKFISKDDLLIFNDTKVINARLFAYKQTGGGLELLLEKIDALNENQFYAQIKANRSLKLGAIIFQDKNASNPIFEVIHKDDNLYILRNLTPNATLDIFKNLGEIPLPPYIKRPLAPTDAKHYQTIYAKNLGAVAAPTAGLHFDDALFNKLASSNINLAFLTLHIASGTFSPIRVDNILEHKMHHESYQIPATLIDAIIQTKKNGGRIISIGTTVMRTLEAACENLPSGYNLTSLELELKKNQTGDTNIFIYPGFKFKIIDTLITNFHLPKSSLFILMSAFAGLEEMQAAYQYAIDKQYTFFSYGDGMMIDRKLNSY